MKNAPP